MLRMGMLIKWVQNIAQASGLYVGFLDKEGQLLTPLWIPNNQQNQRLLDCRDGRLVAPGPSLLENAAKQPNLITYFEEIPGVILAVGTFPAAETHSLVSGIRIAGVLAGMGIGTCLTLDEDRHRLASAISSLCMALSLLTEHTQSKQALANQQSLQQSVQRAEFKALQAQVHPHFLFNTLATLRGLANMECAPKTEEALCRLARLFRYNLSDPVSRSSHLSLRPEETTIGNEINYLEDYLALLKLRFPDRLQASISIPSALCSCVVPRMTLQPLIENVVKHGLEKQSKVCCLAVRAVVKGDVLIIEMADTGPGFRQDKLVSMLTETSYNCIGNNEKRVSNAPQHREGIGLRSLAEKVRTLYGNRYGIGIHSEQGVGSIVRVYMPVRYAE